MESTWWKNESFITKDLYAPFVIESDNDYLSDLDKRYLALRKQARAVGADDESIKIINKYRKKILKALKSYYKADITKSNAIVKNLISDIGSDPFAVAPLNESCAFPGNKNDELQFFRCRTGSMSQRFSAKDMLHLPKELRSKAPSCRFSIPGNPCLYLANSSYGCWIETGFPSEDSFNVAPVVLDGKQKILNLAVSIRDVGRPNRLDANNVHCWLKLLMLMIATSYRVNESDRSFKSEYIISQAVMMACKKLAYDGVAYFSKRVTNEAFALCAINLVLFVDYTEEYSSVASHMKIDDPLNYSLFKQLQPSQRYKDYKLRSVSNSLIVNIGNYDRQHPYKETEFFEFDRFLFASWQDKSKGKGKDCITWGVPTEEAPQKKPHRRRIKSERALLRHRLMRSIIETQ